MSLDSPRRGKAYRQMQAGRHIVMGLILMAAAYLVATFKKFGNLDLGAATSYTMAAFLVLYGGFRVWRGIVGFREADEE